VAFGDGAWAVGVAFGDGGRVGAKYEWIQIITKY
jgi:hypothetical protein